MQTDTETEKRQPGSLHPAGWDVASAMPEKHWPMQPYQKAIIEALSDPKIKRISLFVNPRRRAAYPNSGISPNPEAKDKPAA